MDAANVPSLPDLPELEAEPVRPPAPDASLPAVWECGAKIREAIAELGIPARVTVLLETGLGPSLVALESSHDLTIYCEAPAGDVGLPA